MSRRGSQCAILLNLPSPHTPAHCRLRPPAGSLSSTGVAVTTGLPQGPFLPPQPWREMSVFWRIGLARRQGVSATTRTQVGFAKRLITKPGLVPTKPRGCPSELPLPDVLSRASPVITASPFCPGPFSPDQGGTPSSEPHTTPKPGWVLPFPSSQGEATHRY